jgi:hypothetical protein
MEYIHLTDYELFIQANIELAFTSFSYMVSMVTAVIFRSNVSVLCLSGEVISTLNKDTKVL